MPAFPLHNVVQLLLLVVVAVTTLLWASAMPGTGPLWSAIGNQHAVKRHLLAASPRDEKSMTSTAPQSVFVQETEQNDVNGDGLDEGETSGKLDNQQGGDGRQLATRPQPEIKQPIKPVEPKFGDERSKATAADDDDDEDEENEVEITDSGPDKK